MEKVPSEELIFADEVAVAAAGMGREAAVSALQ
jgi:hypothetical protein